MKNNLSKSNKEIFLNKIRDQIENLSEEFVSRLISETPKVIPISDEEIAAFELIKLNPNGFQSLIRRFLEQNSREVVFNIFCIIDGVSDPNNKNWTGIMLIDKNKGFDKDIEFIHDDF